jgi:hypothetical protein
MTNTIPIEEGFHKVHGRIKGNHRDPFATALRVLE